MNPDQVVSLGVRCFRPVRGGRGGGRGQAIVELALGLPVLLLLFAGIVEFGFLYSARLEISNASRVGARWASKHPLTYTNAASPGSSTIEGQVILAGGTSSIPNDDAHIQVNYYAVSGQTAIHCGKFVASPNNAVVFDPGYSKPTCIRPGSLITVTVLQAYAPVTPLFQGLFGSLVSVVSTSSFLEEV